MTMMAVVRDANGGIIHIGAWDPQMRPRPIVALGGERLREGIGFRTAVAGEVIGYDVANPVATNPLPEGAREAQADIVTAADGALVEANDYAALRRAEYPSIKDQLDAIWKGGADAEAMRMTVMAVKAKYPKEAS